MPFQSVRYPEWKTLYDAVCPLIEEGKTDYSYDLLSELAKVDIRSDRGRGQFYRFRREILEEKQLWFENIPKFGYSIIPAADQSKAATRRVDGAKQRLRVANAITSNVRWDELNPEQRVVHAATGALLHELGAAFQTAARKFRLIAKDPLNALDTTKLLESMRKKRKDSSEERG